MLSCERMRDDKTRVFAIRCEMQIQMQNDTRLYATISKIHQPFKLATCFCLFLEENKLADKSAINLMPNRKVHSAVCQLRWRNHKMCHLPSINNQVYHKSLPRSRSLSLSLTTEKPKLIGCYLDNDHDSCVHVFRSSSTWISTHMRMYWK